MQFRLISVLLAALFSASATAADKPYVEVQPGKSQPAQTSATGGSNISPTGAITPVAPAALATSATAVPGGQDVGPTATTGTSNAKRSGIVSAKAGAKVVTPAAETATPAAGAEKSSVIRMGKGSNAKAFDASQLKPSQRTVPLPTIGKASNNPILDNKALEANVVYVSNRNEIVYVSSTFPNRISTPYANPKVIDQSTWEYEKVGQEIFVTPSGDEPVQIFIVDQQSGAPTASLTLVPKTIPGQNISLVLQQAPRKFGDVSARESATSYVDELRETMRELALNRTPYGYTDSDISVGVARIGQVIAVPQKIYSGSSYNIFVYTLENASSNPTELTEPSFWHEGVVAVSFWPRIRLEAGDRTNAFIMTNKLESMEQK